MASGEAGFHGAGKKQCMSKDKIRVRFAPSPTGYLHIGNLRNAFFNYLITEKYQGDLILRIEDTDQKREVQDAVPKLLDIMKWCGIEFNEGPGINEKFGPYVQSERLDIYKKHADELIQEGKAYYCFCSSERLEKMRADQQAAKQAPRYDRLCRKLSKKEIQQKLDAGEKYVIRQAMPEKGEVIANDMLRGDLKFNANELDDHVLIKSDGVPTYQFASVVDDHLMQITHVLRSEEWIASLPKNILLYRAFSWIPPMFIHPSLILNKTGGKLSKRQGDVAVEDFRMKGYLPEAILNFVVLLGWNPYNAAASSAKALAKAKSPHTSGNEAPKHGESVSEVLTVKEMIEKFNMEDISTSPAVFDIDKLNYLNGAHIRKKSVKELLSLCRLYLEENLKLTEDSNKKKDEFLIKVVALAQDRLKVLADIGELTHYFFRDKLDYDPALLVWKKSDAKGAKKCLKELIELFNKIPAGGWIRESIEKKTLEYIKVRSGKLPSTRGSAPKGDSAAKISPLPEGGQRGEGARLGNGSSAPLRTGDYLWPMRVALTGEKASPSPFEMADALGKDETISRLQSAIS